MGTNMMHVVPAATVTICVVPAATVTIRVVPAATVTMFTYEYIIHLLNTVPGNR